MHPQYIGTAGPVRYVTAGTGQLKKTRARADALVPSRRLGRLYTCTPSELSSIQEQRPRQTQLYQILTLTLFRHNSPSRQDSLCFLSSDSTCNMSVAAMAPFNTGSAWNHRPFASSPLSSSPTRASSPPSSPLADRSPNIEHRTVQSSPIRKSSVFDKFSRFSSKSTPRAASHRQRLIDSRESRRRDFLDSVRKRANDRTFQRREVEGTVRIYSISSSSSSDVVGTSRTPLPSTSYRKRIRLRLFRNRRRRRLSLERLPVVPESAEPMLLVAGGALRR